ncbi:intracellular proteinase inhibitor [Halalkalibacter wakoensis JCM 9140]|uniref:Intracellular proteinase inhibitor n=1 Tax=Halalkalibacter wakoensis JCM 9140 TaxID=1236970 RepID=W4PZG8_9BACI|nr:BsuPI-related putative proteinase inhibitor [Halalkalibacter wakoensis]GAE25236.1 intracellular proteinase inhibitor [Halalkalibacter wakoensis JCM 9140]
MKKWGWLVLITALLLLSACGQGVNAPVTGEGDEDMSNSKWDFSAEVDQHDTHLLVSMIVKNNQETQATIDFSSGQKYEIVFIDQDGNEVYRYSDGRMFTMALVHESFEPGETMTFEEEIALEDIPKGVYTVEVQLVLAAIDGEEWTEDGTFVQQVEFEVK